MGSDAVILIGDQGCYSFNPKDKASILGSGGSGFVYRGLKTKTKEGKDVGEIVAVKELFLDSKEDVTALAKIRKISSIKIDHIGLLQTFDVIEKGHTIYIITEFLDGEAFDLIIERNKKENKHFKVETIYQYALKIIDALGALHHHNPSIIHRDIKPGNIILSKDGELKLLDYGIAKVADGSRSVTIDGSMMGTPAYLPLEQIRGLTNQISPATDFYSVGILLYQLFTNELPFNGSNYEVIRAHEEDTIAPHKKIPASFYNVIRKATDKNPLNRYNRAEKFLKALEQAYENRKTTSGNGNSIIKKLRPVLAILIIGVLFFAAFKFLPNLKKGQKTTAVINETEQIDSSDINESQEDSTKSVFIDSLEDLNSIDKTDESSNVEVEANDNTIEQVEIIEDNVKPITENVVVSNEYKIPTSNLSKFDLLIREARGYKSVKNYGLAMASYQDALAIQNNEAVIREKNKLETFCNQKFNDFFSKGNQALNNLDYTKASSYYNDARAFVITQEMNQKIIEAQNKVNSN